MDADQCGHNDAVTAYDLYRALSKTQASEKVSFWQCFFVTQVIGATMCTARTLRILFNNLVVSIVMLFGMTTLVYANTSSHFYSRYFDISLPDNLSLISKTEEASKCCYLYLFASSNDDPELQMAVTVTKILPDEPHPQSLADFQAFVIASAVKNFAALHEVEQYIYAPENKKVFGSSPDRLKLGDTNYSSVTMHFGHMDAAFLVTNSSGMTFIFTLVSANADEHARKNNLKMLVQQMESIKFNSVRSE